MIIFPAEHEGIIFPTPSCSAGEMIMWLLLSGGCCTSLRYMSCFARVVQGDGMAPVAAVVGVPGGFKELPPDTPGNLHTTPPA